MVVVILTNFFVPCDPVSTLVNGHFAAVATTQHNYPPTNAFLPHISFLMSPFSCLLYHVSFIMSPLSCLLSHVSWLLITCCCRVSSWYLQRYCSFPPLPLHSFLQLYYASPNLIFPLFLISSSPYPSLPYPSLPFLSPSPLRSPLLSSLRSLPFPTFPQALQTLAIFQGKSVRSGREGFNPILADSIFPRCLFILICFCIHQYISPPLLLFIFLSTHTHYTTMHACMAS